MLHAKETGISMQLLGLFALVRPHLISIVEVRVNVTSLHAMYDLLCI